MVLCGRLRLTKHVAVIIAIGALALVCATPRAEATPLFALCVNDSSATTCQTADGNWAEIFTDGVTTTFLTGAGATTVTDSVIQAAGITSVSFTGGAVGSVFTINNIQ